MTKGIDPLYGLECEISEVLPDETVFYHISSNDKEYLSYSIHISLLKNSKMFKLIRNYNDAYHKNPENMFFLSFCIVKTIYTNIPMKQYVYLEDLGKNK